MILFFPAVFLWYPPSSHETFNSYTCLFTALYLADNCHVGHSFDHDWPEPGRTPYPQLCDRSGVVRGNELFSPFGTFASGDWLVFGRSGIGESLPVRVDRGKCWLRSAQSHV